MDLCAVAARGASQRDLRRRVDRYRTFGAQGVVWAQTLLGKVRPGDADKVPRLRTDAHRPQQQQQQQQQLGKKQKRQPSVPAVAEAVAKAVAEEEEKDPTETFRQLRRATVIVDDLEDCQALSVPPSAATPATTARSGKELDRFDVLAVQVGSEEVFVEMCERGDVDIILLDTANPLRFYPRRAQIDRATERGLVFEICYGPIVANQGHHRANCAHLLSYLLNYTGKMKFILSSGTNDLAHIRAPRDLINLARVLGLPERQARDAVCANVHHVLRHAMHRRTCGAEITTWDDAQRRFPVLTAPTAPSATDAKAKDQQPRKRRRTSESGGASGDGDGDKDDNDDDENDANQNDENDDGGVIT